MDVPEKIRLLREATRGADDVYALRGDHGWSPVYAALDDALVLMHLNGDIELGNYVSYPVPRGLSLCWWVGADFDGKPTGRRAGSIWQRDVERAVSFLQATGATLLVNLSRSAQGAHVRALFKDPVPQWMARRWMNAWLDEAQCTGKDTFDEIPSSFDVLCPPQDTLPTGIDPKRGRRHIGNLLGSPCNARHARRNGGTLPVDVDAAAKGIFEPDGRFVGEGESKHFEPNGEHWKHLAKAVASRTWTLEDMREQLADAPGANPVEPDVPSGEPRPLSLVQIGGAVEFTAKFCEFMRHMRQGGAQDYHQWFALAAQLHHFGDDGNAMFHEISSLDPSYREADAQKKWDQTAGTHPVKCTTLVRLGFRCPHLDDNRCAGAAAPAFFFEHAEFEPL